MPDLATQLKGLAEAAGEIMGTQAMRILDLEAQNLALLERNERLEFREMELREALTDILGFAFTHRYKCALTTAKVDIDGVSEATCDCDLGPKWVRLEGIVKKAPYQRTGEAK